MRQAITTKFLQPTNQYLEGRYKATSAGGHSVIREPSGMLNSKENHARVAFALADRLGWNGEWHGGSTKDGYCFVNTDERRDFIVIRKREAS